MDEATYADLVALCQFLPGPASRLLLAALYDPVITSAIHQPQDVALALAAFGLLQVWKAPAWLVVALTALGGALLS